MSLVREVRLWRNGLRGETTDGLSMKTSSSRVEGKEDREIVFSVLLKHL
jgi:hypothetical protein